MALDIYTTVQLLPAVEQVKPQSYFWRDRFFGRQYQFDTQAIAFELLPTEQRSTTGSLSSPADMACHLAI